MLVGPRKLLWKAEFKANWLEVEETDQWLRALVDLPEDPSSILRTHRVAHNCLESQSQMIKHSLRASLGTAHTW